MSEKRGSRPPSEGGATGESPRHSAELEAIGGLARWLGGNPSLQRDLDPLAEVMARGAGADGVLLFVLDRDREEPTLIGAAGLARIRERAPLLGAARRVAVWMQRRRQPFVVTDVQADVRFRDLEPCSEWLMGVSLRVQPDGGGAMILFYAPDGSPDRLRADDPGLERLAGLATLVVRLRMSQSDLSVRERRINELEQERRRLEPLALLGRTSREMAAAALRSVADIQAFARRIGRGFEPGDLNREYLEALAEEAERLDRLLTDHRELAALGPARLRPSDFNALVEEVQREVGPVLSRRKARLIRRLASGLPLLLLDAERLRQVIHQMVQSLVDRLPAGGRLKIETKRAGDSIHLIIGADLPREPGAGLEHVFAPFIDPDRPGDGPLSSLARQVIREHGGEVGARSDLDWPVQLTLSLPIKWNEDRRKSPGDRRQGVDRRAA